MAERPVPCQGGTVYCVTNQLNGKRYVGATVRSLARRWGDHRRLSRLPRTSRRRDVFLDAIRQFGEDAFEVRILAIAGTTEEMHALERRFIADLGTLIPNGYNVALGGVGSASVSAATRAKLSATQKARKIPAEQRALMIKGWRMAMTAEKYAAIAAKNRGQKRSLEAKEKMAAAKRGRTLPLVTRTKMAAAQRERWARVKGDV